MTKTGTKSVGGMELKVGDVRSMGWKQSSTINSASCGQLESGAKYQDVTMSDGSIDRCWAGFKYSILVEV